MDILIKSPIQLRDAKGRIMKGNVPMWKGTTGLAKGNGMKGKRLPEEWKTNLSKPKSVTHKGSTSHAWKGGAVLAHKRTWLKQLYGLTLEQFDELFKKQDGRCGICGKYQPENAKGYNVLCVDHDHLTGVVRGLLCRKCNAGIGQLNDSITLLENALAYLQKHG